MKMPMRDLCRMGRRPWAALVFLGAASLAVVSCGTNRPASEGGSGGAVGSLGGATGSGGVSGTGGSPGTGGSTGVGGTTSMGGASATGGASALGGASGVGGTSPSGSLTAGLQFNGTISFFRVLP
ncbi:MAG TPA: hypothetical protein VGP07_10285 [Polyangia bacterium]